MAEYHVYVRDQGLTRVAEADDFRRLECVPRFNDVGRWLLELPMGSDAQARLDWGGGIVVVRDGMTLLSGPVRGMRRAWNANEDVLVASGPDDNVWLADRLTLPVPSGPPYAAQEHDVRTGAAETVMRAYVDFNAGPSARAERRVPGLTLAADGGQGSTVTGRARFDRLLELLRSLALAGGDLGFRVVQSGASLEFQVYEPTDKTATAIFSRDLGNLSGFEYDRRGPEANHVVCGGGGEGTARTFEEQGDSASVVRYGRIEMFRDRRDTTDAAELRQTIAEELERRAERTALRIAPVDTDALAFLDGYGLGDRVTVVVDGAAIRDVVREVAITLSADRGEEIRPAVGTPDLPAAQGARLFAALRRLNDRLLNLERR